MWQQSRNLGNPKEQQKQEKKKTVERLEHNSNEIRTPALPCSETCEAAAATGVWAPP
jgi:hypothetical protein